LPAVGPLLLLLLLLLLLIFLLDLVADSRTARAGHSPPSGQTVFFCKRLITSSFQIFVRRLRRYDLEIIDYAVEWLPLVVAALAALCSACFVGSIQHVRALHYMAEG
jgi:hypothetical protein